MPGRLLQELLNQRRLLQRALAGLLHADLPRLPIDYWQHACLHAVPHAVEMAHIGRGLHPVQPSFQLGVVGMIVLRVDVPHQRLPGPQRTHQRIFPPHKVQGAGP